jgi:hypothetical protein
MNSPVTPENLFWQNFNLANKIDYDLVQIYGNDLANIFETQAKFLLQDARVIALTTTSSIAYFSNLFFSLLSSLPSTCHSKHHFQYTEIHIHRDVKEKQKQFLRVLVLYHKIFFYFWLSAPMR